MIPDRDYYADKDGKLTDDPTKWARQIAVKGFELDERIAKRYGIGADTLVSATEPNASVVVRKVESEPEPEVEELEDKPQEPVVADEPKVTETKGSVTVKRIAAKKGEKKK